MTIETLVWFVIYAIGAGCILGLLLYAVSIAPVPEPYKGWLRFAVLIIFIFIVIFMILNLMHGGSPRLGRLGLMPDGYGIDYLAKSDGGELAMFSAKAM